MLQSPSQIRQLSRWALTLIVFCTVFLDGLRPTIAQESTGVYQDASGRFKIPVPAGWKAETNSGGNVVLSDPEGAIKVYILVLTSTDLRQAIENGWTQVKPDLKFNPQQTDELPSDPGVEKMLVLTQMSDDQKTAYQGLGQLVNGKAYLLLFDAELVAAEKRAAQLQIIASGFTIIAITKTDLTSVTPRTIDSTITGDLESYITATMAKLGIPGSAVAIVQAGKVVFAKGFGVRDLTTNAPVTPDTYMMIGSTGKSMTTLMMATLVDHGKLSWDDPVVKYLPNFAVADPELSKTLTIRNLVCACTGVPRRDIELAFTARELTAEKVIESLTTFKFFTKLGEAFQYSNQMVATGGYAAAAADGGQYGQLYQAYVNLMQKRVFDPLEMTRTTFSFTNVTASENFATPYGMSLDGYKPLALDVEQILTPVAPAGATWSTASDMARYMLMELNQGVSADGKRVVSEQNLQETWKPQVPVSADVDYGLGWFVGTYKGLKLIFHGGNTFGFTSEFSFLPDADLGIVVLANVQVGNVFTEAVRERLLELVYSQPADYDKQVDFYMKQRDDQIRQMKAEMMNFTGAEVDPYIGKFKSDILGEIAISLAQGKLWLDTGEFSTELRKSINEKGDVRFLMVEPPVVGTPLDFKTDDTGRPIIVIDAVTDVYTFVKAECWRIEHTSGSSS